MGIMENKESPRAHLVSMPYTGLEGLLGSGPVFLGFGMGPRSCVLMKPLLDPVMLSQNNNFENLIVLLCTFATL